MTLGSIAVVQPIVISGVVLAVPVRSVLSGRWPWPRELLAVLVVAVGLTVFLVASSPTGGKDTPTQVPALLICALIAGVAMCAGLASRRMARVTPSAFLLGVASGVLFGGVAGLMKAVVYETAHDGLLSAVTSWTTWAFVGFGLSAVLTNQVAYRYARLSASMPVLNVVDGLVAVAFGVVAFDEVLRHSPACVALEVLAFATISAGLVIVARIEGDDGLLPAEASSRSTTSYTDPPEHR